MKLMLTAGFTLIVAMMVAADAAPNQVADSIEGLISAQLDGDYYEADEDVDGSGIEDDNDDDRLWKLILRTLRLSGSKLPECQASKASKAAGAFKSAYKASKASFRAASNAAFQAVFHSPARAASAEDKAAKAKVNAETKVNAANDAFEAFKTAMNDELCAARKTKILKPEIVA